MIDILDTTDASLVGGKFEGFMKFAGAMRFGHYHEREVAIATMELTSYLLVLPSSRLPS